MLPSPTRPPKPPSEKKERAGDTLGGKSQRSKDAPDHPAAFQVCPAVLGCTCALGLQRRGGLATPGPLPPASLSPRAARVRPTPRSPSATQPPKRFPEGRKPQQKLPDLSLWHSLYLPLSKPLISHSPLCLLDVSQSKCPPYHRETSVPHLVPSSVKGAQTTGPTSLNSSEA